VFSLKDEAAFVYPVTSQYESKSDAVRAKYFKINNWSQAGLDRQSYVDTMRYLPVPLSALNTKIPIGELSAKDKKRLLEFLMK
jgi:hypothetical protein